MASYKNARNSEDIKRELSLIIPTLKDPRVKGMISIVALDLSGDGSLCKVYISSIEGMEKAKEAVKGLNSAAGFIRREIGTRLTMRHTPAFKFIADDSIAYSANISGILDKLGE